MMKFILATVFLCGSISFADTAAQDMRILTGKVPSTKIVKEIRTDLLRALEAKETEAVESYLAGKYAGALLVLSEQMSTLETYAAQATALNAAVKGMEGYSGMSARDNAVLKSDRDSLRDRVTKIDAILAGVDQLIAADTARKAQLDADVEKQKAALNKFEADARAKVEEARRKADAEAAAAKKKIDDAKQKANGLLRGGGFPGRL